MIFTWKRKNEYWRSLYPGFFGGSGGKACACNAGDLGSIPGWGRSPGEGNGNPLQCSCLENSMDWEPGGYSPWGRKELDTTEWLHFTSVLFSSSVVSDSLWLHGLQHARLPCPSLSPGVCSTYVHWVDDAIHPLNNWINFINLRKDVNLIYFFFMWELH